MLGEGQGGIVTAMLSFPCIVERACRDRAVTQYQMLSFRKAWSGMIGLIVIDPVVMPTSNNAQTTVFAQIRAAFPQIDWNQPKGQNRTVITTRRYLTPAFAQELSERMLCLMEKDLPPREFVIDAFRPPPVYFETDAQQYKGVCCVCFKGGCLGKCPN